MVCVLSQNFWMLLFQHEAQPLLLCITYNVCAARLYIVNSGKWWRFLLPFLLFSIGPSVFIKPFIKLVWPYKIYGSGALLLSKTMIDHRRFFGVEPPSPSHPAVFTATWPWSYIPRSPFRLSSCRCNIEFPDFVSQRASHDLSTLWSSLCPTVSVSSEQTNGTCVCSLASERGFLRSNVAAQNRESSKVQRPIIPEHRFFCESGNHSRRAKFVLSEYVYG